MWCLWSVDDGDDHAIHTAIQWRSQSQDILLANDFAEPEVSDSRPDFARAAMEEAAWIRDWKRESWGGMAGEGTGGGGAGVVSMGWTEEEEEEVVVLVVVAAVVVDDVSLLIKLATVTCEIFFPGGYGGPAGACGACGACGIWPSMDAVKKEDEEEGATSMATAEEGWGAGGGREEMDSRGLAMRVACAVITGCLGTASGWMGRSLANWGHLE